MYESLKKFGIEIRKQPEKAERFISLSRPYARETGLQDYVNKYYHEATDFILNSLGTSVATTRSTTRSIKRGGFRFLTKGLHGFGTERCAIR